MMPSPVQLPNQVSESRAAEAFSSASDAVWKHFEDNIGVSALEEEDCNCNDSTIEVRRKDRTWITCESATKLSISVGDIGYIPAGEGAEAFVKVANIMPNSLASAQVGRRESAFVVGRGGTCRMLNKIDISRTTGSW
jgi:hypothetical protein